MKFKYEYKSDDIFLLHQLKVKENILSFTLDIFFKCSRIIYDLLSFYDKEKTYSRVNLFLIVSS